MPRQFGKVDASTAWACTNCEYRHRVGTPCPRPGIWIVLATCPRCSYIRGLYCPAHRTGGRAVTP